MAGIVGAFMWREEAECRGDQRADLIKIAWSRGPQKRFEFGEREFDGIEIRAVGRKEAHLAAHLFDGGTHLGLLVRREIVEHDNLTRSQRRHEDLFDVPEEWSP